MRGAAEARQPPRALLARVRTARSDPFDRPRFNPARILIDPKFTVAGVTDASSAGSHGSSASAPTTEALAKATVALGKDSTPGLDHAAEEKWKAAADRQPNSFEANREAGLALASNQKPQEALDYLERASRLDSEPAKQAEIHHLLGTCLNN